MKHIVTVNADGLGVRGRGVAKFVGARARKFMAALLDEPGELSVALVGDEEIRALKRRWFGIDEATDVLSFPAGEDGLRAGEQAWPAARLLGDIVISVDTAARVAKGRGAARDDEIALYLAHGLLHLLGMDHIQPGARRQMRAAEARLLGRDGLIGRGERRGPRGRKSAKEA